MNSRYTRALFIDQTEGTDRDVAIYTLASTDFDDPKTGKHYPSLYRLYMDLADPTEWDFANLYFEDYDHWTMITESPWFKPVIQRWRKELDLKVRAQALRAIRELAGQDGKDKLAANRFLVEKGYVASYEAPSRRSRAGRPSKDEIKQEAEKLFSSSREIEEDFNRLSDNLKMN